MRARETTMRQRAMLSASAIGLAALVLGRAAVGGGAQQAAPAAAAAYTNPVIPGFHPDPSVARVGEDFYLVTSSFEFFPGVPIFRSRDLVHWQQLGHVLTRDSQLPLAKARPSGGIYAPTIRHHDGTFYMITTNIDGGGNFYVTAKDPAGPWSEPVWLRDFGGIDPSLFFDDDGKAYVTGPGGGNGQPRGMYQAEIDVKSGKLLTPTKLLWDRTGARYPEGPHLYKIRGRYYLMLAEGGTEYGHMEVIARSATPWGPWEPCPRNPILTNRQTEMDVEIQGTGHADLVEDPAGRWWLVFLAFRPVGGYWHHLGRETNLAPVTWDADGWPVVNAGQPIGRAVSTGQALPPRPFPPVAARTGFDGPLGPEWNYLRNPHRESYAVASGSLQLRGSADALDAAASPTWVGRRQQHLDCTARTVIDFSPSRDGEEAGLSVYMNPDHRYELAVTRTNGRRHVLLRQRIGPHLQAVTGRAPVDESNPIVLQVRATANEYEFSFGAVAPGAEAAGALRPLGKALTRYLSSEVAGGFTGVYFGLYATGNGQPATAPARFDWLDYELN